VIRELLIRARPSGANLGLNDLPSRPTVGCASKRKALRRPAALTIADPIRPDRAAPEGLVDRAMVGPVPAGPRTTARPATDVRTDRDPRIEATIVRQAPVDHDPIATMDRPVGNGVRVRSQPVGTINEALVRVRVRGFLRAGMTDFAGMTDRIAISVRAGRMALAPTLNRVEMMVSVPASRPVETTAPAPALVRVGTTARGEMIARVSVPGVTTVRAGSFRPGDLGRRVDRIFGALAARARGATSIVVRVRRLSVLVRMDLGCSMLALVAGIGSTDPGVLCRVRSRDGRIGKSSRRNLRPRPPGWNWPSGFSPRLRRPFRLICSCDRPCPGASN
jgi:hypothetical protein